MPKQPLKILAIIAGHDRICCVFAIGEQPMDWQMSFKATKSKKQTKMKVCEWIDYYNPDIILLPLLSQHSRKGARTRELICIAKRVAEVTNAQVIEIPSAQVFENKYLQIQHLCERYPQLKVISVKPRKYWENENPRVSYFEAVEMIHYLNEK